jgi:hypothetical protein
MNTPDMNRRTFLKTASFATAAVTLPNILRSQGAGGQSPNNKLNIACCGVGGVLAEPSLSVFNNSGTVIASNTV